MEFSENLTEVIIALIGALATVSVAFVSRKSLKKERARTIQAENEIQFQVKALDFGAFLTEWGDLENEVRELMETSELERFIIFRAFNGEHDPRWTTAVLQIRGVGHRPVSYVHVNLDEDYVDRLKMLNVTGHVRVTTGSLEKSMIKEIYESENVEDSLWCFIDKEQLDQSIVYTYCSFATTNPDGLSNSTLSRCKVLTGRLQGMALSFHDQI